MKPSRSRPALSVHDNRLRYVRRGLRDHPWRDLCPCVRFFVLRLEHERTPMCLLTGTFVHDPMPEPPAPVTDAAVQGVSS